MNTKRIYIKNLNANDTFMWPGTSTRLVCVSRKSEGGKTLVGYRVEGEVQVWEYVRPGLSTVDLITF